MFRGDEGLLIRAFGGILQAVLAVVRSATPATIRCAVAAENAVARVEVSQTQADLPAALLSRFFDHTFHDRPGGYGAAVNARLCRPCGRAPRRSCQRREAASHRMPCRRRAPSLVECPHES